MSIGDFSESLSQAMLVGCNVCREIGHGSLVNLVTRDFPRKLRAGKCAGLRVGKKQTQSGTLGTANQQPAS